MSLLQMTFTLSSQAFKGFLEPQTVRADTGDGCVQNDDLEHVSHYDSATAKCDACMRMLFALPHACARAAQSPLRRHAWSFALSSTLYSMLRSLDAAHIHLVRPDVQALAFLTMSCYM